MLPNVRRNKIIELLEESNNPISGSELSLKLDVSRQVIVQDIAILRAEGYKITATSQGYVLDTEVLNSTRKVIASNHDKDDIEDELNTIVDMGGTIIDVIVEHNLYGQLSANLMVSSRREVKKFVEKIKDKKTKPLCALTDGVHLHTIEAKNEEIIKDIEDKLFEKGYLLR